MGSKRERLRAALLAWYARYGRGGLPWRTRRSPYRTLVSEFMLAQTQADRVAAVFDAFVERFASFEAMAAATVADVLRAWQGLGYNSRAVRLHALSRIVAAEHGGELPQDSESLRSLPGIGPYTAAAVRSFAFDIDDAAIDVNVRRVVQRVFFGLELPRAAPVAALDEEALALVAPGRAHDWNSAMMDLGATVCTARAPKCLICPLRVDCEAAPVDAARLEALRRPSPNRVPAEKFERTIRFARGRIVDRLRALEAGAVVSFSDLHGSLRDVLPDRDADDVRKIAAGLERDGLVTIRGDSVALRE
ncbi:MAG TPA: A/G-specific adenine glycosylase [Candidatus Tumulicola sp.]|jgi:A/G-specific adenine glycosylase